MHKNILREILSASVAGQERNINLLVNTGTARKKTGKTCFW